MSEGSAGVVESTVSKDAPQEIPVRIDLSKELVQLDKNASAEQKEAYELESRYREIVKEAGAEPNRGTPYIEAALAEMGYQHVRQPSVDEKIAIQLKHPGYNFGPSLTPENDHAAYIGKLQPIPPK